MTLRLMPHCRCRESNKVKRALVALLVLLAVCLCGCSAEKPPQADHLDDRGVVLMEKKYYIEEQKLTTDQKIGQLLFIDYRHKSMDDKLDSLLTTIQPGGFILFGENFSDYANTLKLVRDIKSRVSIPMFIGCDEEGGVVQRIRNLSDSKYPTYQIPSMLSVGNRGDAEYARKIGEKIGSMCRVFGINMDFAPVADVNIRNGNTVVSTRSFGADADLVASMATAVGQGLQSQGVIAVYKHFPGHGSSVEDSHKALAVNYRKMEEIEKFELVPFARAIGSNCLAIMVGHIAMADLHDPSDEHYLLPATLDREVITGILRQKMGFEGLIITDSLQMNGLTNSIYKTDGDIAQAALEAGCDLLLCPRNSLDLFNELRERVKDGRLDERIVDEAVLRILRHKRLYISDNYDEYYDATNLLAD